MTPRGTPEWAMDPRSRKAIEAEMTGPEVEAMCDACGVHGVPFASWLESENLRRGYVPTVAIRMVQRGVEAGHTRNHAIQDASLALGIPEGTLASWVHRYGLAKSAA